jgi:hypothetical protein
MPPPSPLLTSMPGMRVLDAHVHIGCHHLLALKVYHQLALAGIEGARRLADPENLYLPRGHLCAWEVADRWGRPWYLTRRRSLHIQKYPYAWLPSIPATPLYDRCVTQSHRFSPCDDLGPRQDGSWLANGHERLTQGLRKRTYPHSHPGRALGAHPRVPTRLLLIPTPLHHTSRKVSSRELSGVVVLGSRRVVPTGRLATRGEVPRVCPRHISPRPCWRPSFGGK